MYKDKDKQREANKEHAKAYRKRKGMTLGYDDNAKGMTLVKAIEVKRSNRPDHHPTCKCLVCAGK